MSPLNEAAGAITRAQGFRAAGLACGIKQATPDLALVAADAAVPTAAVFTTSRAAAAPVQLCRRHLAQSDLCRAVIFNSGRANAATGKQGLDNAEEMVAAVAQQLDCPSEQVLVCSTGVIGLPLPMDKIRSGIEQAAAQLAATPEAGHDAANAILTTDTRAKEVVVHGEGYVIGGMAKGAAMVRPDMATMLALVTTDAVVAPDMLARALAAANARSINAINIDGCQSTNDTVIVLASGASKVQPAEAAFTEQLTGVCKDLARQIVGDAECATRVITLEVSGAPDDTAAREIGKFVADSDLVRSSFYGGDPNWGRIVQALGVCSVPVDPEEVIIRYAGVDTCRGGIAFPFDEAALVAELERGDFTVEIVVGAGPGSAQVLTADLTPEYVSFNGERS
jgi:glutamate N-acetyltransferase/amino-acid N-acetyltransferase